MGHRDVRYAIAAREDGLRRVRRLTVTIGSAGFACCAALFVAFAHNSTASGSAREPSGGAAGTGTGSQTGSGAPAGDGSQNGNGSQSGSQGSGTLQAPVQAPAPAQGPAQGVSGGS